jgi:hypothetical protein
LLLSRHSVGILGLAAILLLVNSCGEDKRMSRNKELPPVALEVSLEPAEANIGDRIRYIFSLNRLTGIAADLPEFSASLEGLTRVGSGHSEPKSEEGRSSENKWITYQADRIGTWIFPAMTIHCRYNGEDKEIRSGETTLNVKSVLSPLMTDINDIKPLEDVRRNLVVLSYAGALVVLLLSFGVWFSRKRWKKPGTSLQSVAPDQEAIEKLLKLENMKLIQKGELKKHYSLLSEIFRKYIERQFAFPAMERTSEEISGELASLHVAEPMRNQIHAFLGHMDLVKFAQAACTADEARTRADQIRRFVVETTQQNPKKNEEEHVAV